MNEVAPPGSKTPTTSAALPLESASPGTRFGRRFSHSFSGIAGPLIGLVLVLTIFGIWRPNTFLTRVAFESVLRNNYNFAVAAVGMTFVIVTAGIDLSIGSTMALACVSCALAVKGFTVPPYDWGQATAIGGITAMVVALCAAGRLLSSGQRRVRAAGLSLAYGAGAWVLAYGIWWLVSGRTVKPMPVVSAIAVGVAVGGLVGLLNGVLITSLALPPFIVTLATLEAVRGVALYVTDAVPVSMLPPDLRLLHYGSFLGIAPNVWIAVALIVISAPVLHFTVLGRYAYAIGSNERTARLCGVPVERYKTICYVISGACAGLAGVMMAAKFNSGPPDEFQGAELTVIAAVVIGGTSLFGGEGTIVGSVLGVLMLGFLYTGCNIANISPHVQRVFIGGTIVLAAAADRFRHIGR